MLKAVDKLEKELARYIVHVFGREIRYKPMRDELEALVPHCEYTERRPGKYEARVHDAVVQVALWQITDRLPFDELACVLRADTPDARANLSTQVRAAIVILGKARLQPIVVPR